MMSQRVKSYLREITEYNYICHLEDSDKAAQLAALCFLRNKINKYKNDLINYHYNQFYNYKKLFSTMNGTLVAITPLPIIRDGVVLFPVDCSIIVDALKRHWRFNSNPESISLIVEKKKLEAHCYSGGRILDVVFHDAEVLVYNNISIPFKFLIIEDYSFLRSKINE